MGKLQVFYSVVLLGWVGVLSGIAAQTEVVIPQTQSFQKGPQRDYLQVEQVLLDQVKGQVKDHSLNDCFSDPVLRQKSLAWDVVHTAGATNLNMLVAKDPRYEHFLSHFLKDSEWMILYGGAGKVPSETAGGIQVLADLWARELHDKDFLKFRNLMTGIATTWGYEKKGNLKYDPLRNPIWRYYFFKQSQLKGKLQKDFLALRPWELRFVVGKIWDDASLEWAQNRIHLPPHELGSASWAAPYCSYSEFGNTIQGALYYLGLPGEMSKAEQIVKHGGGCGALSTFGHLAAKAHGYVAYTCGQPGHCAWGYRLERGHWTGAYMGPHGRPSNWIFPGTAPAAVDLMEAAFADNQTVDLSVQQLAMARLLGDAKLEDLQKQCWRLLLKTAPLNYNLQQEFLQVAVRQEWMKKKGGWKAWATDLIQAYAAHGYAVLGLLRPYEKQIYADLTPEEKLAWGLKVEEAICRAKPSWANQEGGFFQRLWGEFKQNTLLQEKLVGKFLRMNFEFAPPDTLGRALESVVALTAGKEGETFVVHAIDSLAEQKDRMKDEKKKAKFSVFGKAIVAAEKARSYSLFKALSLSAKEMIPGRRRNAMGKRNLPDGILISGEALLCASSSGKKDRPCEHWNLLHNQQGFLQTNMEKCPNVVLRFPKAKQVSTIVIIPSQIKKQTAPSLKLYRSTDFATWFPIAETSQQKGQWIVRLPEPEKAAALKVELQTEKKGELALQNFMVFGK